MNILAFGELLFDCYPTQKKIGGAPFNFAAHLSQLGAKSYLLSAVGKDVEGQEAKKIAESFGVNTSFLQVCENFPTGLCTVSYQDSEPRYDLSRESAYEHISYPQNLSDNTFDVLYFGTLAQRGTVSYHTLQALTESKRFPILFFDMNLRQHYYTEEVVTEGLKKAHMVKLNREEFSYVKHLSHLPETDTETALRILCDRYEIQTLILTLDKDGACVLDKPRGFFCQPIQKGEFVSAVGAGDSFCACFLYHYLLGTPIKTALEKASMLSAFVVSKEEAVPEYGDEFQKEFQVF